MAKYIRRFKNISSALNDQNLVSPNLTSVTENNNTKLLMLDVHETDYPLKITGTTIQNLTIEKVNLPARNEVWYRTVDNQIYDWANIYPALVQAGATYTGSAVISNEWDEDLGYFVMKFAEPITHIGGTPTEDQSFVLDFGLVFLTNTTYGLNCNVSEIILPRSVIEIKTGACIDNSNLINIRIPNSVTTIKGYSFTGCSSLTTINIPSSVTNIEVFTFNFITSLSSINVDSTNTHYSSLDGVLFNKDKSNLIAYPAGNPHTSYTIPNTVTNVLISAFDECYNLTSIIIPNSVTYISEAAFVNTNITSINIPNSVYNIEMCAFSQCYNLTAVEIGSGILNIGYNAFSSCSLINSIICHAITPPHCDYTFEGVNKSIPVYVPLSSVSAYKAADEWKDFTNIQAIE